MKQHLCFKITLRSDGGIDLSSFLEFSPLSTEYHHGVFMTMEDMCYSIAMRREKLISAGIKLA